MYRPYHTCLAAVVLIRIIYIINTCITTDNNDDDENAAITQRHKIAQKRIHYTHDGLCLRVHSRASVSHSLAAEVPLLPSRVIRSCVCSSNRKFTTTQIGYPIEHRVNPPVYTVTRWCYIVLTARRRELNAPKS